MKQVTYQYLLKSIFILGLVGVLLASFLTVTHYTGVPSSACPKHRDGVPVCDIVNQSIYSELFGIPVALLAVLVYGSYSIMSYLLLTNKQWLSVQPHHLHKALLFLSGASLLFAAYLVTILYAILKTACVYCLIAHTITLSVFSLSVASFFGYKNRK